MRAYYILVFVCLFGVNAWAQTVLKASPDLDSYDQINQVLAPGYNVVETPDCKHTSFGKHITTTWDAELKEHVFVFHSHVNEDNDRCKKFDRARTEIKTYKQSPDSLIAVKGETVLYKWKFKIGESFTPSKRFTHIHQIKAVGGDESSMPTITITLRKTSSEQKLQILHASSMDQEEVAKYDLEQFKGNWVQVEEKITYGELGSSHYSITITDISTQTQLINFQSDSLRMWKNNAEFLRPKWGIYRSLKDKDSIKDEQILFSDFYIQEL